MYLKNVSFAFKTDHSSGISWDNQRKCSCTCLSLYKYAICIYAYLDQEPTKEDYNTMDCAITEIMADCPQFQTQNMIITKTNTPIGFLKTYKG